jgi:hypothetical protein
MLKKLIGLGTLAFLQTVTRPIFIVPGLGGSIIENEQNNVVWPPPFWRVFSSHLLDDLEMSYNFTSECFYPKKVSHATEIATFYNKLSRKIGNNNVHTVPYDFRLVGNEKYLDKIYKNLKIRIETEVKKKNEKCTIVAHSFGGNLIHDYLLNHCSNEWKKDNIHYLITVNTPYGGSTYGLNSLYEKKMKIPFTNKNINFDFVRYIGGILWTLPNKYCLPDNILLKESGKHYKSTELDKIITKLDREETYYLFNKHFNQKHKEIQLSTNVRTYVLYSRGKDTISCINKPKNEYSDGDGTVCIDSLLLPLRFNHSNIITKEITGDHVEAFVSDDVLNTILFLN